MVDPFEYLHHDKMIEICESLDNESLAQLVRTSKKAYDICQQVLITRKTKKDLEDKRKIKQFEEEILTGFRVDFVKNFTNGLVSDIAIIFDFHHSRFGTLWQVMYAKERYISQQEAGSIPTILPLKKSLFYVLDLSDFSIYTDYNSGYLAEFKFTKKDVSKIARNLVEQKYLLI